MSKKNAKSNIVETAHDDAMLYDAAKIARSNNVNDKRFRSFCRLASNVATYNIIRNKKFTRNTNEYKVACELVAAFVARTKSRIVTE